MHCLQSQEYKDCASDQHKSLGPLLCNASLIALIQTSTHPASHVLTAVVSHRACQEGGIRRLQHLCSSSQDPNVLPFMLCTYSLLVRSRRPEPHLRSQTSITTPNSFPYLSTWSASSVSSRDISKSWFRRQRSTGVCRTLRYQERIPRAPTCLLPWYAYNL